MKSRLTSFRRLRSAIALMVAAVLMTTVSFLDGPAAQAAVPGGFTDSSVMSVSAPTDIAFTPDGTMLVTSQSGRLYNWSGGTRTQILDISGKVCSDFERGLLGVTVDPNFGSNHYIYLFYTWKKFGSCPADTGNLPVNRVSRFVLNGSTASGETVLVDNMPSTHGNHNAGSLLFGKDGYLYISIGDGGCQIGAPSQCGAQNGNTRVKNRLQGKVLRVDRDGHAPTSNPFYSSGGDCRVNGSTSATWCRETYGWGFRNPFRIAANPNSSGTQIYVNDVGQSTWEEIDQLSAGKDYGWNVCEGKYRTGSTSALCQLTTSTLPIYEYFSGPDCNSITGGAFIPNGSWPSTYDNAYFFADYTCGTIWTLKGSTRTTFASGLGAVTELEFGPYNSNVALYYADYGASQIRRIAYTAANNRAPVAKMTASPTYGAVPLTVAFDARQSSDPDGDTLTYRWDFGDGSSSTQSSFSKTYQKAGKYRATLTVSDGRGGIDTDSVTIQPGNTRPDAEITSPTASMEFSVGQTITLTGMGTDAEDGTIPSSRMTWQVLLHHDTHTHPFFGPTTGNNLTFQAPAPEDLAAAGNSYLEIRLTVRDSGGLGKLVSMNLMPNKVNVTVGSNVPGMLLWIEGAPYTAPDTVLTWEGNPFTVLAPDQIGPDNQPYIYKSWSDGGRRSHNYIAPASDATVTANFNVLPGDSFAPHADARVSEANPTANYGGITGLSVKGGTSSDYETVIRFKLTGVGDRVYRARLYLYAYDPSVDGPSIYETSPSWSETGVTWNTRPAPIGGSLDNYGPIADNSWIAYDVAAAIDGNGYVAFVIRGSSSDAVSWYSRQAVSRQPRLVVWSSEVAASEVTPEPSGTPVPEASPIESPTPEATESPTPIATPDLGSPTVSPEPLDEVPFSDGFEGDLSGWSSDGALLVPGAGPDGSQAAQLQSAGSVNQPGAVSYIRRDLADGESSIHVAFDLDVRALDPSATRLATFTSADSSAIAALYVLPDSSMGVRFGDADSLAPVGSLNLSIWNRIEVEISAGNVVTVWVNGPFAGSASSTSTVVGPRSVLIGGWGTDRTYDLLIDNVAIDRSCVSGCPEGPAPTTTTTPETAPDVPVAPEPGTPVSG